MDLYDKLEITFKNLHMEEIGDVFDAILASGNIDPEN